MNAGQEFVINGPVGEQVRLRISPPAGFELLGRHVRYRPDDKALARELHAVPAGDACDAEVHDLHAAVGQQHDISGFYVAVDHSLRVRIRQPFGNLRHDPNLVEQRYRFAVLDDGFQRLSFEQLHHEIRNARLLAAFEQRHDVLVPQISGGADLDLEALQKLGIRFSSEDFDSDGALYVRIVGAIHPAKSTAAEFRLDSVLGNFGNHAFERRSCRGYATR